MSFMRSILYGSLALLFGLFTFRVFTKYKQIESRKSKEKEENEAEREKHEEPKQEEKKKIFKDWKDSAFCRRLRDLSVAETTPVSPLSLPPSFSSFSLMEETLSFTGDFLAAQLLDSVSNVIFVFELSFLKNNTVHFKINELNSERPRYQVNDVLVGKMVRVVYERMKSPDGRKTIITFDKSSKVILQHSPFQLEFFVGEEHVLSINSNGLLKMEHYRKKRSTDELKKPESPSELLNYDELKNQLEKETELGYWEEDYLDFLDSKPFGPSAVSLDVAFPGSLALYGIPEHSGSLALKPTKGPGIESDPYRLYNLDVFTYPIDSPIGLYGSNPYIISQKPKHSVGFLWLNASETWVDVSEFEAIATDLTPYQRRFDTHWMSESGIIEGLIFLGPSTPEVMKSYSELVGYPALPPLFSLGYHQCRWNYNDQADVVLVDEGFEDNKIPCDVIWLDIEHTDSKKYFTWDKINFPQPIKLQEYLASKHRKLVTIIDPHIKRDESYSIHQEASENKYYVTDPKGKDFQGSCWPGASSWVDFVNPRARDWWASKFAFDQYEGSTRNLFVWNDMNEPSVFDGPELTLPKDCLHEGGWEHRDVHNQYGFYQQMATFNGLVKRSEEKLRPFVLTRSFFTGSQRYGAIWTGDNGASWEYLQASIPMILSMGVSGFPFVGADIGGFFGDVEEELFVRWYQLGAFNPFFRGHSHHAAQRREPWMKGDPFTSFVRQAILMRYSLLPYWYTLFHRATVDGLPVIRPMFLEYPEDLSTFQMEDQFLLGSDILVKPVTKKGTQTIPVYLPTSHIWYDYETFKREKGPAAVVHTPLTKIPAFIRGGAIIPRRERAGKSATEMINDPISLIVALDSHGKAQGELYFDDGESFDYKEGHFTWKTFSMSKSVLRAADKLDKTHRFYGEIFIENITILGLEFGPSRVKNHHGANLSFSFHNRILTIKKTNLPLNDNWEVHVM